MWSNRRFYWTLQSDTDTHHPTGWRSPILINGGEETAEGGAMPRRSRDTLNDATHAVMQSAAWPQRYVLLCLTFRKQNDIAPSLLEWTVCSFAKRETIFFILPWDFLNKKSYKLIWSWLMIDQLVPENIILTIQSCSGLLDSHWEKSIWYLWL